MKFLTIKELAKDPDFCFTEAAIRKMVFDRKINGLKKAIRKIGKRVLIRKDLFAEWLDNQIEE